MAGVYGFFDDLALVIVHVIEAQKAKTLLADKVARMIEGPRPDFGGGLRYINSPHHRHYVNKNAFQRYLRRLGKQLGLPKAEDYYA